MSHRVNITRIRAVANIFKELNEKVVFVGGATVSLYSDKGLSDVRPTDDIDVVIKVTVYKDYAALEERLRSAGFVNDIESKTICRYRIKGITVDVMPIVPEVIGFSNKWYPAGFANAIPCKIDDRTTIYIFSLPYFIASKIEAHKSRGNHDYRFSKDFEDIVFLFENVSNIQEQLAYAQPDVKAYLMKRFGEWLNDPDFVEGLTAHLTPQIAAAKSTQIFTMMEEITGSEITGSA